MFFEAVVNAFYASTRYKGFVGHLWAVWGLLGHLSTEFGPEIAVFVSFPTLGANFGELYFAFTRTMYFAKTGIAFLKNFRISLEK